MRRKTLAKLIGDEKSFSSGFLPVFAARHRLTQNIGVSALCTSHRHVALMQLRMSQSTPPDSMTLDRGTPIVSKSGRSACWGRSKLHIGNLRERVL
jgi:hypothetical protein